MLGNDLMSKSWTYDSGNPGKALHTGERVWCSSLCRFNPQNIENYNLQIAFHVSYSTLAFGVAFRIHLHGGVLIKYFVSPSSAATPAFSLLPSLAHVQVRYSNRFAQNDIELPSIGRKSCADPAASEKIIKESFEIDNVNWYPRHE